MLLLCLYCCLCILLWSKHKTKTMKKKNLLWEEDVGDRWGELMDVGIPRVRMTPTLTHGCSSQCFYLFWSGLTGNDLAVLTLKSKPRGWVNYVCPLFQYSANNQTFRLWVNCLFYVEKYVDWHTVIHYVSTNWKETKLSEVCAKTNVFHTNRKSLHST